MATLYTHAEENIKKTWFYITGFLVLIILVGWFISYYYDSSGIFWFAFFISIITSFSSYWFSDKIVLSMSHAKPIEKSDNPELYRLVENLCITAGLPLPTIYIIQDPSPNAFATGRNPKHAVIAFTTGILERLERSELEGVVAHELSHIGNRDALLQTAVVVLVGLLVRTADVFLRMGRSSRRDKGGKGGTIFFIFAFLGVIIAPILAQLLRFAISRKREFLADASGALLTRYPEGLAQALEKISTNSLPVRYASNATAHLFIVNPLKNRDSGNWLAKIFSTHPPVAERIAALRGMEI